MRYITPQDHELLKVNTFSDISPVSFPLYIVCAISNPQRYASRYRHYRNFEKHVECSGGILYTVELALRDRHHEVTSASNPRHIQLRSNSEMWHKENLLNIGISRLPEDWKYAAWMDADMQMSRPDWVTETVHQLQHYRWVQMFSSYADLGYHNECTKPMYSFAYLLRKNLLTGDQSYNYENSAPGGGFAFRREAFEDVGGLLDTCILGSADFHMAYALANKYNWHKDLKECSTGYAQSIRDWSRLALSNKGSVGYVENHALHYYHGPRANRFYQTRWQILKRNHFDPRTDLKYDHQGVLSWVGNKPLLEEEVKNYFRVRDEDR